MAPLTLWISRLRRCIFSLPYLWSLPRLPKKSISKVLVLLPLLMEGHLNLREVPSLSQGHTANKWKFPENTDWQNTGPAVALGKC